MTKEQIKRQVEEDVSTSYNGAAVPARIWSISSVRKALNEAAAKDELDDDERCSLVIAAVVQAVFEESQQRSGSLVEGKAQEKEIDQRAARTKGTKLSPHIVERDLHREEDRLSEAGLAAGRAAGDFLAWHLERDGSVRQFREAALGGSLFGSDYAGLERAWRFITSPLMKLLSFEDFQQLNLCPREARGRILLEPSNILSENPARYNRMRGYMLREGVRKNQWGHEDYFLYFHVEVVRPDGSPLRLVRWHESNSYKCIGYQPFSPVMPDSPSIQEEETPSVTMPETVPWLDGSIRYSEPGTTWEPQERPFVEGYGSSVVNECLGLLNYLAASYPVEIWQLLRFILTGTGIYVPPIFSSAFDYNPTLFPNYGQGPGEFDIATAFGAGGPITLRVQPWVQPDALAEYWRGCRFRSDAGRTPPKVVNLELFRFVLKHTRPGKPFQWQQLADRWYTETGDRKTRTAVRNAFLKTREDLFPSFEVGSP